ncbi:Outer membrane usher protein papC precursor [Serratia quinivorans]|uniref:outer membrane usher protein n=1 Tax=Serratia proteamaculans TaxID=28151 RepID=UPI000D91580F|nr:outer membrane usher protein [Serratia proteamaculans]CAI2014852.1 Outer membrane usher protein papC precursor [Serratia proteamaculans]SPZ52953.1 Outer membrane usher protein papC precursor [Serratia quinivorans]
MDGKKFKSGTLPLSLLRICISLALCSLAFPLRADDAIQFNTDILDLKDRENIDLSRFSTGAYIMPGTYNMTVLMNKQSLDEQPVAFYSPENDPKGSVACISPQLVEQLGFKAEFLKQLRWWHNEQCLDLASLKGIEARGDLAVSALYLNIPQAYLEYSSPDWDPPARWDNGIPGLLLDYNLNGQAQSNRNGGGQTQRLGGNGAVGANLGAWRLRADWQTNLSHQTGSGASSQKTFDWSRYYAYRALPKLGARLALGEDYLQSNLFDSFRFTGFSLMSDDNMLPPNLRGYAPEVTGIAKTNAKVTVSQQGRVLYEAQVAAGPFRIQDLSDSVMGKLDVKVEEQDGSVQQFQVDTANIPYLTRPGMVRYKFAGGRPSNWEHNLQGPPFAAGEFSWGVSNGWSLYSGAIAAGDYTALSLGLGRDLLAFGALSFDSTQSRARLPSEDGTKSGGSYRLSYSKSFDEYDSQVTFAGYRFSEQDFMTMSEYLDARYHGLQNGKSREMYTITFNKQFRDLGVSTYLNYDHQTYWDKPTSERYSLALSRYFDLGSFRNMSASLTAYRNKAQGANDDGMYLSLSVPWGVNANLSYSSTWNRNSNSQRVGYYSRLDEHNNYQLSAGSSRSGESASGFYSHDGDIAKIDANVSYQGGQYSSIGMGLQGGATFTAQGAALHRNGTFGGTRLMLDTDGVAGVPVRGFGATSRTNMFGKAVVADVSSYYRSRASIDLTNLSDDAEATQSMVQATLTEGAIGYRRFNVISGQKAMAVIRLADGNTPPFGAEVFNRRKQQTGIVNDGGRVYLSGIRADERMTVHWEGKAQCEIDLPAVRTDVALSDLLLPCRPVTAAQED